MAMIDLGKLGFDLILNRKGWQEGWNEADEDISKHQSKWSGFASNIAGGLKTAIVGSTVAIGAAVGTMAVAGVKNMIELDDHMAKFKSSTGMTAEEAEKVKETVKELYKVNEDSYGDIAKAAEALHNNMQMTSEEIKQYTQNYMDYAKVTGQATEDAIGAMDDIADAWGLANEEIIPVMDKLKYSQEQYGLAVQDSQGALQQLAPSLKGLGMSLDDGIAYLNLFASTGVEASTATTAFSYALRTVESPQELDDAISKMQSMTDDTERAKLAVEIFGARAGVAMANAIKPGTESLDELKAAMEGADGAVSKASTNYDASLKVQLTLLMKQLQGLFTELGDKLAPLVHAFVAWLQENMPAIQATLTAVFEAVGAIISGLVEIIGFVAKAFVDWYNGNSASAAAFKAEFEQFKVWFIAIFNLLKEIVNTTLLIIKTLWDKYGKDIIAIAKLTWDNIKIYIETAMKLIKDIINLILAILKGDWQGAWNAIKQIFIDVWEAMKKLLPNMLEGIYAILRGAFNVFKDLGRGMFNMVWEGMKAIWESISRWVTGKVNWLKDKLSFWKKSKNEMSEEDDGGGADGSHANGLSYVPFDGYRAILHEGEGVLTKQENAEYRSGTGSGGITQNIIINSPEPLTPSETARQTLNASRQLALEWGV